LPVSFSTIEARITASAGLETTVSGAAPRPEAGKLVTHRLLHAREEGAADFAPAIGIGAGKDAPLLRHGDRAGEEGRAHQPVVDEDRGHAFGHGDHALDRAAVLQDVEDPRRARTRRNLELAGLDRVARAEDSREAAVGDGIGPDQPFALQLRGDAADARAALDDDGPGLARRSGPGPERPVGPGR
jgi:hypothetical protein